MRSREYGGGAIVPLPLPNTGAPMPTVEQVDRRRTWVCDRCGGRFDVGLPVGATAIRCECGGWLK